MMDIRRLAVYPVYPVASSQLNFKGESCKEQKKAPKQESNGKSFEEILKEKSQSLNIKI